MIFNPHRLIHRPLLCVGFNCCEIQINVPLNRDNWKTINNYLLEIKNGRVVWNRCEFIIIFINFVLKMKTKTMWPFSSAESMRCKTGHKNMSKFGIDIRKSQHWQCCVVLIIVILLPISRSDANHKSSKRSTTALHIYKGSRYTIDDLLNSKFSYKISDDIDMDPCKASTYPTSFSKKQAKKKPIEFLIKLFIRVFSFVIHLHTHTHSHWVRVSEWEGGREVGREHSRRLSSVIMCVGQEFRSHP